MDNKLIGGAVAALGIVGALAGYLLWHDLTFKSKKLDAALAAGVILLIVGIYLAIRPSTNTAS